MPQYVCQKTNQMKSWCSELITHQQTVFVYFIGKAAQLIVFQLWSWFLLLSFKHNHLHLFSHWLFILKTLNFTFALSCILQKIWTECTTFEKVENRPTYSQIQNMRRCVKQVCLHHLTALKSRIIYLHMNTSLCQSARSINAWVVMKKQESSCASGQDWY